MQTYDTLTYGANEKSLAWWGFSLGSCIGEKTSQSADTWRGTIINQSILSTPIFPFEAIVTIQSGRVSSTGLSNSFSGGVIKFTGTRLLVPTKGDSGGPGFAYEFQGGRYFLDNCQYKQYYAGKTGTALPAEIIMFCRAPYGGTFSTITAGQQISDIINYAIGVGLNAQLGTIDSALSAYFPWFICKPMTCSAAIDKCLEYFPTVTEVWDYTFTPPKVSFIQKNNLTPVTLSIFTGPPQQSGLTYAHKEINITRRDDLVARAVVITYRITSQNNSTQIVDYAIDQWGPIMEAAYQAAGGGAVGNTAAQAKSAQTVYVNAYNGTFSGLNFVAADAAGILAVRNAVAAGTCDPREGIRVPSDIIDLSGFNVTTATAFLDCEPVLSNVNPALNLTTNASSVDAATQALRRQWWSEHRGGGASELGDTKIRFQQNNSEGDYGGDDYVPPDLSCIAPATLSSGDLTGFGIANAGRGYFSGDILYLSGGETTFGSKGGFATQGAATIQVQDVDEDGSVTGNVGGIISAVISNGGYYATLPSSPNTPTGGSGSGASFTLSFASLAAILAQYPNRIVRGTHHSWMVDNGIPIQSIKLRIKAVMQYAEYDVPVQAESGIVPDMGGNGNMVTYNNAKEFHCDLELTNGVTGNYQTVKSTSTGDTYVIGVDPVLGNGIARQLYLLLNGSFGANPVQYQHEGDYVKVDAAFTNGVTLANSLNLSGGLAEWATMKAQITGISENYGTHVTSVKIGPSKHLSAQQLSSLLNMWRIRWNWFNPAIKEDNTQTTSGDLNLPITAGNANTTSGTNVPGQFSSVTYNS